MVSTSSPCSPNGRSWDYNGLSLRAANVPLGSRFAVDTVFDGKRKISPTIRTRTGLIPDIMMLEREAALKPAR